MDDNSKIITANFPLTYRQRRRRSSQAASRAVDNGTDELNCIVPSITVHPPAIKASTPKTSCSEDECSLDGEDITEKDMTWLTQITEQPVVTPLRDVMHSESELDDSNDHLLLPYNNMDASISPLPPTPSMNVDGEANKSINSTENMSTQYNDSMSDDGLSKERHYSPVVLDDDNENIEESTLICSQEVNDDADNVVVTIDSPKMLLEKATGNLL